MTITDRLDQIEARANAATKGPWATYRDGIASPAFVNAPSTAVCEIQSDSFVREPDQGDADGSFIAHARTDMPAIVAALRAVLELADRWATQSTDYDEDTEQQIDDGKAIVRAIEEALS